MCIKSIGSIWFNVCLKHKLFLWAASSHIQMMSWSNPLFLYSFCISLVPLFSFPRSSFAPSVSLWLCRPSQVVIIPTADGAAVVWCLRVSSLTTRLWGYGHNTLGLLLCVWRNDLLAHTFAINEPGWNQQEIELDTLRLICSGHI